MGKERVVVEDMASAGFDEVLLTVAKDGMVYWDSEVAADYGLGEEPGSEAAARPVSGTATWP